MRGLRAFPLQFLGWSGRGSYAALLDMTQLVTDAVADEATVAWERWSAASVARQTGGSVLRGDHRHHVQLHAGMGYFDFGAVVDRMATLGRLLDDRPAAAKGA